MSEPSLRKLQEWMSAVVRHPKTAIVAIHSQRARTRIAPRAALEGAIVKLSKAMTPPERLDIYNGGYLMRLVEAVESDYRGVSAVLGHGEFHRLIARYVTWHPSRHQNLNRFGKQLPEFLRDHLADRRAPFLFELARLEREMTLAFDAPEFVPLSAEQLGAVGSQDLEKLVLVPNPSLRLARFAFPVDPFLTEVVARDHVPPVPRRKATDMVVFRNQGRVWRAELDGNEASVLRALHAGKPLGKALGRTSASPEQVSRWFTRWASEGFFVALRT